MADYLETSKHGELWLLVTNVDPQIAQTPSLSLSALACNNNGRSSPRALVKEKIILYTTCIVVSAVKITVVRLASARLPYIATDHGADHSQLQVLKAPCEAEYLLQADLSLSVNFTNGLSVVSS